MEAKYNSQFLDFSIMNITAAFNKTSIVWQDVFDYHKRVSSPVHVFYFKASCNFLHVMHSKYFDLDLMNIQSKSNERISTPFMF